MDSHAHLWLDVIKMLMKCAIITIAIINHYGIKMADAKTCSRDTTIDLICQPITTYYFTPTSICVSSYFIGVHSFNSPEYTSNPIHTPSLHCVDFCFRTLGCKSVFYDYLEFKCYALKRTIEQIAEASGYNCVEELPADTRGYFQCNMKIHNGVLPGKVCLQ